MTVFGEDRGRFISHGAASTLRRQSEPRDERALNVWN
jgi:hypothetical protein